MNVAPAIKGLITAALMIATTWITYYTLPADSPLHYLVFGVYGAGIIWAVTAARNSPENNGTFWAFFNTGFRCLIIAILVFVVYTFVYNKLNPQFAEEMSKTYRADLLLNEKNKTPDQIEETVASYKKNYAMALVYGSILGYLLIGLVVNAVTSALLSNRK
jgi:hypothetical protein